MYLNSVTLTGFVGGDAETRTTRSNTRFVVFSMATRNSWRDRESEEWTSRTEWHRAVVFGRLTDLAATLKKGDHIQIQGQLRTREYEAAEGKMRVTEIRVTSILKLDRSGKQTGIQPEAQEVA
jgi:single-strand DNA-binding protein